jgi:opacity protein-like surface antigen
MKKFLAVAALAAAFISPAMMSTASARPAPHQSQAWTNGADSGYFSRDYQESQGETDGNTTDHL